MLNTLFGNILCRNNKVYSVVKSYKIAVYAQRQAKILKCKWTKQDNNYLVIKEL
jgi:hypothetical protein